MTGFIALFIEDIPVIIDEFLASLYLGDRHNTDRVVVLLRLAIGRTRMIDIAGGVLEGIPVDRIVRI
jgi:hypothetical protein